MLDSIFAVNLRQTSRSRHLHRHHHHHHHLRHLHRHRHRHRLHCSVHCDRCDRCDRTHLRSSGSGSRRGRGCFGCFGCGERHSSFRPRHSSFRPRHSSCSSPSYKSPDPYSRWLCTRNFFHVICSVLMRFLLPSSPPATSSSRHLKGLG